MNFHVASPPQPSPLTTASGETLGDALKKVTPALLIVGIATGAAFAIGSGLVTRYVFGHRRSR